MSIPDLLDMDSSLANQELVMLRLSFNFRSDSTQLLLFAHLLEQLHGLLDVLLGSPDSDHIGPRVRLGELDGDLT